MEASVKYDNKYFENEVNECADEMLKKCSKEKVFANKEEAEAVLKFAKKEQLTALFQLSGKEFYLSLLTTLGTIRFTNRRNEELNKAIDKLKADTGLEGKSLKDFMRKDEEIMKSLNGENTLKIVIAKVLGILRFTWDTVVLGGGFTVRVTKEFATNFMECLRKTKDFAVKDAKYVGEEIKASWNRNTAAIDLDDYIDDKEGEIAEIEPIEEIEEIEEDSEIV